MLIWSAGRIIDGSIPLVSAEDRALEHGLGLFETLRIWDGSPALLDRHFARMSASTAALGIPFDPATWPSPEAIRDLVAANGLHGDAMLRITLAGGTNDRRPGPLWMRASPLPPPMRAPGMVLVRAPFAIDPGDPIARHKALNYWSRRLAHEHAQSRDADDALMYATDDRLLETSRMNVFLVHGETLRTPEVNGPIVPGILRGLVREWAGEVGLPVECGPVTLDDLSRADAAFATNAVRGIVPIFQAVGREFPTDSPVVRRLQEELARRLLGTAE